MFEKEAEKILNKHCNCEFISECIDRTRIRCSDFEEKKKLLLEGIELGYKKANEWHYVKNGDYPKENQEVLVFFILPDNSKNSVAIVRFKDNDFDLVDLQDVIAWKEIVFPKMEDE